MNIFEQEAFNLIFGISTVPNVPIVYGAGGCLGGIVTSPAPICVPYFPPVASIPPVTEVPIDPPYFPPDTPMGSVSIPGTWLLVCLGLVLLRRRKL